MSLKSNFILAVFFAAVAIFFNYPSPELSPRLKAWKDSGKYFNFNGQNIFYKDEGTGGNGDVLVIFHGFPTCGHDFHKIWPGLTSRFSRVIMPDFLGYGFSDKPKDHVYSLFDHADMVEALLGELGLSKVHILAHDMGDTVAQELIYRQNKAKQEPENQRDLQILSVCLSNGGIIPETIKQRFMQKVLLKPYLGALLTKLGNRFVFTKGLGEVFGRQTQPTSEEFQDHWTLVRYNSGQGISHLLINYLRERYANRDRWVNALSETTLPLHLIFGPSDPVNPYDPFLLTYKKLITNSGVTELELHIGHYPQLEAPKEYLEAFLGFFHSVPKNEV